MSYSNMASASNFWSAIQTSKTRKKGDDNSLYLAEEMYEAGMRYVIKEMARHRYSQQPAETEKDLSDERKEAIAKATTIIEQLRSTLTKEQLSLVRQWEDEMCADQNFAEEEQYIRGFYDGYKYVKELP